MTSAEYKVLITTSGMGSRLGELTNHTNKALVSVGGKPVLSHIIETYPTGTPFVITLGYKGSLVKQFINLVYPDLNVEFIEVDKFEGPGSSLLYSMYQAREQLQCPFIFHASDTIVYKRDIETLTFSPHMPPSPVEYNWDGVHILERKEQSASYRTVRSVHGSELGCILEKGENRFASPYVHIGLCGISDWADFWRNAEDLLLFANPPEDTSLSDAHVINLMREQGKKFILPVFPGWHDVGNIDALEATNKALTLPSEDTVILPKSDQATYLMGRKIVKFFKDAPTVERRVKRAEALGDAVPAILGHTDNFYMYEKAIGPLFIEAYPGDLPAFLLWCQENLWVSNELHPEMKDLCTAFYYKKTWERLTQFYKGTGITDGEELLNGESVPSLMTLMKQVPWHSICNGRPTRKMHGDLHFSNVIKTEAGYKLIDWREDFGGCTEIGDVYYDLAKLNHGMIVSHDLVNGEMFTIKRTEAMLVISPQSLGLRHRGEGVEVDIHRHQRLVDCQNVFYDFLTKFGYDRQKVDILTALIYLNICPLHHYPYNIFLYYFGKKMLFDVLKEVQ